MLLSSVPNTDQTISDQMISKLYILVYQRYCILQNIIILQYYHFIRLGSHIANERIKNIA